MVREHGWLHTNIPMFYRLIPERFIEKAPLAPDFKLEVPRLPRRARKEAEKTAELYGTLTRIRAMQFSGSGVIEPTSGLEVAGKTIVKTMADMPALKIDREGRRIKAPERTVKSLLELLGNTTSSLATAGEVSLNGISAHWDAEDRVLAVLNPGSSEVSNGARRRLDNILLELGVENQVSGTASEETSFAQAEWTEGLAENHFELWPTLEQLEGVSSIKERRKLENIILGRQQAVTTLVSTGLNLFTPSVVDRFFRLFAYTGALYSPYTNETPVLHSIADLALKHTSELFEFLGKWHAPTAGRGGALALGDYRGLQETLIAYGAGRELNYPLVPGTVPAFVFNVTPKTARTQTPEALFRRFYSTLIDELEGFFQVAEKMSEDGQEYGVNWEKLVEALYELGPSALDKKKAQDFVVLRSEREKPHITSADPVEDSRTEQVRERLNDAFSKRQKGRERLEGAGGHQGYHSENSLNQAQGVTLNVGKLEANINQGDVNLPRVTTEDHPGEMVEFLDPSDNTPPLVEVGVIRPIPDDELVPLSPDQQRLYAEFIGTYFPEEQVNPQILTEHGVNDLEVLLRTAAVSRDTTRQRTLEVVQLFGTRRGLQRKGALTTEKLNLHYQAQRIVPSGIRNDRIMWSAKDPTEYPNTETQAMPALQPNAGLPPGEASYVSTPPMDPERNLPDEIVSVSVDGRVVEAPYQQTALIEATTQGQPARRGIIVDKDGRPYHGQQGWDGVDRVVEPSGKVHFVEAKTSPYQGEGDNAIFEREAAVAPKTTAYQLSELQEALAAHQSRFGDPGRTRVVMKALTPEIIKGLEEDEE